MSKHRTMIDRVKEYLAHRRALGFALDTSGNLLIQFARFADRSKHRGPLTADLALRWASLPKTASPRYRAERLSIVRGFARYLAGQDGQSQVPGRRLLGRNHDRLQPHIYSEQQLRDLVLAAAKLPPVYRLRPSTYSSLFGPDADAFFVGASRQALPYSTVRGVFRRICSQLGWRSNGMLPQPRLHDLRHSFACRRLLRWYQEGINVDHAISSLSTYLGHAKVTDTYWYLTGTAPLLATAGQRFEQFTRSTEGGNHEET